MEARSQSKSTALVLKADDPRLFEDKNELLSLPVWDRNAKNYRPADYNSLDQRSEGGAVSASNQILQSINSLRADIGINQVKH